MQTIDKKPFGEMMTAIFSVYGKEYSSTLLEIWWNALERFDLADVRQGLNLHVSDTRTGQFLPKPADVIRNIEGDPQSRGMGAWAKVYKAIKSVGGGQSVAFDDPLIHVAIQEIGGWTELCLTKEKEISFKGQAFQKRYENLVKFPPKNYPAKMLGYHEASNLSNGHANPNKTVLIGDQRKAQLVLQKGAINHSSIKIGYESMGNVLKIVRENKS